MKLHNIVFKSITQRLLKTVFVFLGISIGVSTIVAVYNVTESMKSGMTEQANFSGPDIIITPDYKGITMAYGGITLPEIIYDTKKLEDEDLIKIREILNANNVDIISPKITGIATGLAGRGYEVNGIIINEEARIYPWLFENISINSDMSNFLDKNYIIIGKKISESLNANEGDELILNDKVFLVASVLDQIGGAEDLRIYMNLENAGRILNREDSFSSIQISLGDNLGSEIGLINVIKENIPHANVFSPRRESLLKNEMLTRFTSFGFALSALVFIVGTLLVSITVMGSVKEKTIEIGIFRALGFKKVQIAKLILLESGLISFFAGISGYFIGNFISQVASKYFSYMDTIKLFDFNILILSVLLSIISGLISSIYPSIKGANLDPIEAMRYV